MTNLIVTVMAGGNGTRMCSYYPKVLHLFEGKPMLTRIIETVVELNPKKIIVVTGKDHAKIVEKIQPMDNLVFVQQLVAQGTGDAIKCCLPEYDDDDNVLIVNGDMPKITVSILDTFVNGAKGVCNILCANFSNPKGYGRVIQDKLGDVVGIIEEKDCNEEERNINIINTGLYYINGKILKKYIPLISNNNNKNEYYLTDIVKQVKNNSWDVIHAVKIHESANKNIMGVNTQEDLEFIQR